MRLASGRRGGIASVGALGRGWWEPGRDELDGNMSWRGVSIPGLGIGVFAVVWIVHSGME